ncbi:MAG: MFS transporter [Chloroflexi bacterium]|nr:MFS transporter [Chloroflexota bacterium]
MQLEPNSEQIPSSTQRRSLRDKLSMPAWALYDFSDTIFSASILTLFFPLWVIAKAGGEDDVVFSILFFNVGGDSIFAFTLSFSALVIALTSPLSGTVSDSINRRVPLLAACVISCTGVTAVIGMFGGLTTGLALFFIANFLYQTGLVFYNSLIVNISSEENRGIVSGIGVGMGYVGLFIAFLIFRPQVAEHGEQWAFIPTALMYVLFASPLLIIVKDVGKRHPLNLALIGDAYNRLYTTFRRARSHANLFKFIAARFIYMEAVNTVTSFYLIYLVSIGVFTRDEALELITWVLIVAFSSSVAIGFLVSKFGSKRVLGVGIVGWTCFVIAGSIVDSQIAFRVVAVTAGLFWAAPQIADRVLLTRLAPEGQVGEFFGLFQMSGRLSSAVGPALWGVTTTLLWDLGELRFRIAMLMLAVFLGVGFAILLMVREQREESDLTAQQTPIPSA